MARRKKKTDQRVRGYDLKNAEERKALIDLTREELRSGKTLIEALGVSQAALDNVYALAYEKYQKGEFEKARDYFRYLVVLDGERFEYVLGLAAALHRSAEFEEASRIYICAALLRPEDPVPLFHGADCYLKMGDKDSAKEALVAAINISGTEEKYSELKTRAELITQSLGN